MPISSVRMDCIDPNEIPNSSESSLIVIAGYPAWQNALCQLSYSSCLWRPSWTFITLDQHPSLFERLKPLLNWHTAHCLIPTSFLNHIIVFWAWMPKLLANLMQMCYSTFSVIVNVTCTTRTTGFGWLPGTEESKWETVIHACTRRSKVTHAPLPALSAFV